MPCSAFIHWIAKYDGLPMQRQLQLRAIANRVPEDCGFDDALLVAYIVFRQLWHAEVRH